MAAAATQGENVIALKRIELPRKAITEWRVRPPLVGDARVLFTDLELTR